MTRGRARGAAALALCALAACASEGAAPPRPRPTWLVSAAAGGGRGAEAEVLLADVAAHRALGGYVALGLRVAGFSYEQTESQTEFVLGREIEMTQTDRGKGLGLGPELRVYPLGAFDGPWVGAGFLWFPFTDASARLDAVDVETGIRVSADVPATEIDRAWYGALGWTFRTGTALSVGLELDLGEAGELPFGVALLRLGWEL